MDSRTNTIMKLKLSDFTDIQFGIYLRPDKTGDVIYLQGRNFDNNGILKESEPLQYIHYSPSLEKGVLKHNDILFTAKGARNTASLFKEMGKPTIASSIFFVIRIKEIILSPEYLALFLNLNITQNYFLVKRGVGTTIPSIKKFDLEDLIVDIPPVDVQEKLVSLNLLCEKEKQLLTDIVNKKEILYQSLFNKVVKGELK